MSNINDHVILVKTQQEQLPGSSSLCEDLCDHAGNHQLGGRDPVNVTGLSGLLADQQKAGYIGEKEIDFAALADQYLIKYEASSDTFVFAAGTGAVNGLQLNYEAVPSMVTKTAAGILTLTADETSIDINVAANSLRIANGANRLLFATTAYSSDPAITASNLVLRGSSSLKLYAPNGPLFQCNNIAAGISATDGTATDFDTTAKSIVEAINENAGEIAANAGDISVNIADIAALDVRVSDNETDIAALQGLTHAGLSGDNNSDADYQHYDQSPDFEEVALEIVDGVFSDGSLSIKVASRDMSLVKTGDTITGDSSVLYADVNDHALVIVDGVNITAIDTNTLEIMSTAVEASTTSIIIEADTVYQMTSNNVSERSLSNISNEINHSIPGLVNTRASVFRSSDGLIWSVDNNNRLVTIDRDTWTYSTIVSLVPNITNLVLDVAFVERDTVIAVADFPAGSGSGYVRLYTPAGVYKFSTLAISTNQARNVSVFEISPGWVGVQHSGRVDIIKIGASSATVEKIGGTSFSNSRMVALNGDLLGATLGASSYDLVRYQIPALSLKTPGHLDLSDHQSSTIKSQEPDLVDQVNSFSDFMRNHNKMQSLMATGRRPRIRTTSSASSTVEVSDENNIIIADNSANAINLYVGSDVRAIEGFRFTIWPTTPYGSHAVTVSDSNPEYMVYKLNSAVPVEVVVDPEILRAFRFIVINGQARPEDGTCDAFIEA